MSNACEGLFLTPKYFHHNKTRLDNETTENIPQWSEQKSVLPALPPSCIFFAKHHFQPVVALLRKLMLGQVTAHLPLTRFAQCFYLWQLAEAWLILSN